jgi:hypothetical protein
MENYIGKKFNMLTIIELSNPIITQTNEKDRHIRIFKTVICKCDCGNITPPKMLAKLKTGHPKSCGCLINKSKANDSNIKTPRIKTINVNNPSRKGKTRMQHSFTYNSFRCMRDRCNNPKNNRYESYGGRGIKVCDEWGRFDNFLRDMGERPQGYTLDRIDVNGNYELSNCKWSTPKEQALNRRNSHININP